MGENGNHEHDHQMISRTMISGDRIEVLYRCACGDEYTEDEYT